MSKLDELIAKLCPNGVAFKELKQVLKIRNGKDYKHLSEGNIPVYGSGGVMTYVNEYAYDKPSVLIPRKGSIDKLYYVDIPFWTVDTIFYTEINTNIIEPKYVFYVLQKMHLEKLNTAGGVPSLTQSLLNSVKLPVPPLEVQREIVRMLDNFTFLTAELTAELTARRKQYEHYRNDNLSFGKETDWRTIGEIFDIRNGYTPSKKIPEYWENGSIPWFRLEDIRTNGRVLYDAIQHVHISGIKKSGLFKKDSIMIATTATLGEHAIIKTDYMTNQQLTNLTINDDYRDRMLPKFAFYYFYIIDELCKSVANYSGGIPIVDQNKFRLLPFPVPSIEKQEEIVALLDKFDSLCNDISIGLPAEIAARQKQYEYYRDKLLTFKELNE